MKFITAEALARLLPYDKLVEALRQAFAKGVHAPVRHHHQVADHTTLLLMPAWDDEFTGIKTVTVKPGNAARGLATVQASYLLIDNATGTPVCQMDGTELTRRRTAAASALASTYLSRTDSSTLVLVGAGALAPHFARAHAAVRPIKTIIIHNRTVNKAHALATALKAAGLTAEVSENLPQAVGNADIVSGITSAREALIFGEWIKSGTHIDLAGAFTPAMRQVDGQLVAVARVYVDTADGAKAESGDLIQAAVEGRFSFDQIQGDLADLARHTVEGRRNAAEITVFCSCGTALEDLAAAKMAHLQQV